MPVTVPEVRLHVIVYIQAVKHLENYSYEARGMRSDKL